MQALGVAAALAAVGPFLVGPRLLAPVDAPILANLPDAPRVADPDFAHGVFNDAILQLLPWEAEVRRSFAAGHLPLWSDLLDGGSSPWVNPQAAVLSPVAWLARLLPLSHFLLGALAVKVLLSFEGLWLLARALGARRWSAGLAAAGFALGGPILAWAVFPLSSVVAWSPWLLLGTLRVVRRPGARKVALAAAVAGALLLSGHPEVACAEGLAAAGFAVVVRSRRRRLLPSLGAAALAAALGLGLAACQAVPFALVVPHSLRAAHREGETAGMAAGGGQSATASAPASSRLGGLTGAASGGGPGKSGAPAGAAAGGVPSKAVTPAGAAAGLFASGGVRLALGLLNPWAFGRPFHEPYSGPGTWPIGGGGYLGLVALAGAAAALASRRRRLVAGLGALAAGMLLLTAGFLPFRALRALLPLGRALAYDRFLPVAALLLALLAALGLDELLRRGPRVGRRAAPASAWTGPGAGSGTSLTAVDRASAAVMGASRGATGGREALDVSSRTILSAWLVPEIASLAAAAASLTVCHDAFLVALWVAVALGIAAVRFRPALGLAALVLAAAVDLGAWARDVLPAGHRELFYPRTPLVAAVAGAVAVGGPWRAVAGGFAVYPSLLPMYGVAEVRIDNPLALAEQLRPLSAVFEFQPEGRRYKSAFRNLGHPLLDFLNVRAVVLAASAPAPERFRPLAGAASTGGSRAQVRTGTQPRRPPLPEGALSPRIPRNDGAPSLRSLGNDGPPPLRVLVNEGALPRCFLPVGAEVRGRAEALAALSGLRDARRVILLREETGGWRAPEREWSPGAVAIEVASTRPGRVSLRLPAAGEKLLATSLPFPAGWTATGDRRALRPLTVNTAYFGAVVPAGVARVELRFEPPGFRLGVALSALSGAALLLLGAAGPPVPPAKALSTGRRRRSQGLGSAAA